MYIDDRRVAGRVPKRYMGAVRIESIPNATDLTVDLTCPFCQTSMNISKNCACPDCESKFNIASMGEHVVIVTRRNASNPTI